MALTLKQSQAIIEAASGMYDLLPGSAHPYADQSASFQGVATELGLAQFWEGGSKLPAIRHLITEVLERQPGQFCQLLVRLVEKGLAYRATKGSPVMREEIEGLNFAVAKLGFKIPELWDKEFLATLPSAPKSDRTASGAGMRSDVKALTSSLQEIMVMSGAPRGYAFERFLGDLFDAFGLAPRGSFRLIGEQIDGSFCLASDTYLVEAKWQDEQVGEALLNSFAAKVRGKAEWSRGVFVSYSGFSPDGLFAFGQGKRTNIVCLDGLDLHEVVNKSLDLRDVITEKVRRAAETNRAHVPVREL